MLAGDVEGVEEFLKAKSNYGPLFCAWERIKKELAVVQKPIAQQPHAVKVEDSHISETETSA